MSHRHCQAELIPSPEIAESSEVFRGCFDSVSWGFVLLSLRWAASRPARAAVSDARRKPQGCQRGVRVGWNQHWGWDLTGSKDCLVRV